MFHSARTEIAQEGIACAEGQKPQPRSAASQGFGVEAVHYFIRSAVATDSDEIPNAAPICFARYLRRISRCTRLSDFNFEAAGAQPIQGRTEQFAAFSPACRRIHNGQVRSAHEPPQNRSAAIPFSDNCLIDFSD